MNEANWTGMVPEDDQAALALVAEVMEWRLQRRALQHWPALSRWMADIDVPAPNRDARLVRDLRPTLRGQLTCLLPLVEVEGRRSVEAEVLGALPEVLSGAQGVAEAEVRYLRLLLRPTLELSTGAREEVVRRTPGARPGEMPQPGLLLGADELARLGLELLVAGAGLGLVARGLYALVKLGLEDTDLLAEVLGVGLEELKEAAVTLADHIAASQEPSATSQEPL